MAWTTVKASDIEDDKNIPYKYIAHKFTKKLLGRWIYCSGCGLITLRNDRTFWCIKVGCDFEKHLGYRTA